MPSEERKKEILQKLYDAVVNMDEDAAKEWSQTALNEDVNSYEAVTKGLAAGMGKVGELYTNLEYFVPELLLCADALYAGLEILRPHIKVDKVEVKKQIILGTVEGDIHDIGKNLVKVMFEAAGWIVHDLGADVQLHRFVEEQKRINADLIGLSALMTTSMLAIPKAIEMLRADDPATAVIVGGAPLTLEIARSYGADGYAKSAGEAVKEAIRIVNLKK